MILRAVLKTRDPEGLGDAMQPKDLYFVFDNCSAHIAKKAYDCFVNEKGDKLAMHTHKVHYTVDEDSLCARKCLVRTAVCEQVEIMHISASQDFGSIGMPYVRRKHFNGTNMGTKLGDVVLPNYATLWSETCKAKHDLYGKFRVACGGPTKGQGEDAPGRGTKRKTPSTVEPVFWHGRPGVVWAEILHSYRLGAVVDLTVGDGQLALQCARQRIPYFGFCLTAVHATKLCEHLIEEIMNGMLQESDPMFDPKLAALMQQPKKLKMSPVKETLGPSGGSNDTDAQAAKTGADSDDESVPGMASGSEAAESLCNLSKGLLRHCRRPLR